MPTTEIGIDVQTMSVERKLRRNRKMISVTRAGADQRVLLHGVNRPADVHRAVVEDVQLDVGHLRVDARDFVPDALGDLHRVRAGLLLHGEAHAGQPVDAKERPHVFGRVDDFGDVADVNRHAAAGHEHEIADFVEALELGLAAQQIGPLSLVHFAQRRIGVLRAQQR